MTFTKVQRIELLLEEIKQILGTIKEEENDQDTDRRAQDVIEISTTVATEASTTDSESDSGSSTSHSTDTDIQSTGDDSSSSQCSERDLPDLCVRCFNNWEGYIMSGQYDFPSCQFDQGRGRKKCRYCSSRRSECVKVNNILSYIH